MKNLLILLVLLVMMGACIEKSQKTTVDTAVTPAQYEFVMAKDVDWSYLNPVRKDKAPMAGTLFGDRNGNEPTGYLLKPKNGFSSPPHIHNVSYRGIVISGFLHNDDPDAADMWMPSGSFWTQPKGEVHITSAKGDNALAYIEIDEGPYLVLSADEHFDSGERPINIEQSNIAWVGANEITWLSGTTKAEDVEVAFLWGKRSGVEMNGTLVKLPQSFKGRLTNEGDVLRAVVINGALTHQVPSDSQLREFTAGSYFGVKGKASHLLSTSKETIVYLRTNGSFDLKEI